MISEPQNLNWIDYVIISVVAFSALISFFRGFLREAISLIAWALGLFVSLKYSFQLQICLQPWISSESVRYFVTFVSLFLMVVLAGLLVNVLIHMLLKKSGMSLSDRFIGIFFGIARGIAIISVILLMLSNLGTVSDSLALNQSILASRFKPVVSWLNKFLPNKMKTFSQWVQNNSF